MDDINQLIKQSFDSISLILVFVFVLFGIRYPQINDDLKKEIPDSTRKIERKKYKEKLKENLSSKALPLVIIYGFLFYLFLPLLLKIFSSSKLQLWDFDIMRTTFVVVDLFILSFLIWSLSQAIRLIKRIQKCN